MIMDERVMLVLP